jgi:hypothetical protein
MTTKTDIKKLLAKSLTGKEAARLILQDSWQVDHGKEGFLSDRDISSIKASLRTTQDQEDYNRHVEIYRLVDFTLKEARIYALEAQLTLMAVSRLIDKYELEDHIRSAQLYIPAIVTQKQYEELKAKQKASRLQEIYSLKQVLEDRAESLTPEAVITEEWSETEEDRYEEYLIYFLQDKYPDLWKQTVSSLLEVIKAGKIKPVQVSGKEAKSLEKVWQQVRDNQTDYQDIMASGSQAKTRTGRLLDKEQELLQKLYKTGQARDSQASIVASLEQLLDGSLSEENEYKLLEYTFFSAEELYKAGLPEWIKEIDSYDPSRDEETGARPAGMIQSINVAIIQEPDPVYLDERGYWQAEEINILGRISGFERQLKSGDLDIPGAIKTGHSKASENIKAFLAIQAVTEAISNVIGVNFSEDMDNWYESLDRTIQLYNWTLAPSSEYRSTLYLGMPKLNKLKIGKLKPTARSIKYYQERMALALGQDWSQKIKKTGISISQLIEPLEFEGLEEDSLAQKMAEDIDAYTLLAKKKKRDQEASSG